MKRGDLVWLTCDAVGHPIPSSLEKCLVKAGQCALSMNNTDYHSVFEDAYPYRRVFIMGRHMHINKAALGAYDSSFSIDSTGC
jgi:hypothetical protein